MFGDNLRALRRAKKMSRETLGGLLGVTGAAVYKWETGKAEPGIDKLVALADYYGVTVDALVRYDPAIAEKGELGHAMAQMSMDEIQQLLSVARVMYPNAFQKEAKDDEGNHSDG